ncbi:MAG: DUF885 family protein [Candidatus Riflebacteria bacterium]|nr:DUF885 family protein [Candidatus Riflebacteria bacterium]
MMRPNLIVVLAMGILSHGPPLARAQPAAAAGQTRPGAAAPRAVDLATLIRAYEADRASVASFYDLPWSTLRRERLEKLCAQWQARVQTVGFDELDRQSQIDWLLLDNLIGHSRDDLARTDRRLAEMDRLLPFRAAIHELEWARWRGEPLLPGTAATRVDELARQVRQLRESVDRGLKTKAAAGKPSDRKPDDPAPIEVAPPLARRTAEAVDELKGALRGWFAFYDGSRPDFSWWLKKPQEEAIKQLDEYAKLLREEAAGLKGKDEDPLVGDPIGADALTLAIRREFLTCTTQELIDLGHRELAWGESQMKLAARAMGLGDDWKAALARVKADFVAPGGQDDLVARTAREAIDLVKRARLMEVPTLCEETWRISMMSPETMKTVPYAAYGGQKILVAYAKDEMKHEDKLMVMRGNNRHFTRLTTPHELIPGHHLQAFFASRHRSYRRLFSTPFLVEGWALYGELRLWELGWARTPQERIGMLFWRMNRAARIVVSLKYHLGQMKPDQMVEFLVDRVGHEKLGATSEVRRFLSGEYSPLYQAAYLIGGLQLKALHDEVVGSRRMSEIEFHDAVLTAGPIPIHLIRAGLQTAPLTRAGGPPWRFADR